MTGALPSSVPILCITIQMKAREKSVKDHQGGVTIGLVSNCLTLVHILLAGTCLMDTSDCEEGWEVGLAVHPEGKKIILVNSSISAI